MDKHVKIHSEFSSGQKCLYFIASLLLSDWAESSLFVIFTERFALTWSWQNCRRLNVLAQSVAFQKGRNHLFKRFRIISCMFYQKLHLHQTLSVNFYTRLQHFSLAGIRTKCSGFTNSHGYAIAAHLMLTWIILVLVRLPSVIKRESPKTLCAYLLKLLVTVNGTDVTFR